MGLHISWNVFMYSIFGMSIEQRGASLTVMSAAFSGGGLVSGGEYGAESGLACTAVLVAGLVLAHFCIKKNEGFWSMDSDMPLTR
jgi:hypothetical protein